MREKLTRFVLLVAMGVFAFTMVGLAQQPRPFPGIAQRALLDNSLGQNMLSTGLGFGSELPTMANSNLDPKDGELFAVITRPPSEDNYLGFYAVNATAWRGLVQSTLESNRQDLANSVQVASSSIIAEGATADAFETTISFPDLPGDWDLNLAGKGQASTDIRILDTGADPATTVEVPDREFAPPIFTPAREKAWFRTMPTFATGAASSGIISACSTTGNPNWLYGPAVTGFGFELDAKGTVTECGPSWLAADGMGLHADDGDNEGQELTQGIVDGSPGAFTIGTSPAFYATIRMAIGDESDADEVAFGFRIAQAYDDSSFENYTDFFVINVDNGVFWSETSLNTTTDVDVNIAESAWTDNQVHTIEIRVSAAGVATAYIEGSLESDAVTFTFDDGDVVIPFLFMLSDAAGDPDVDVVYWESGLQ